MKKLIIAAILLAVVAGAAFLAYHKMRTNGTNGVQYERVEFQRGRIEVTIESTGVVEPRNRIEIKPPIGGRMEDVLVDEGQTVKKGGIIAWMSSTERATLLDAARAKGEEVLRKWENAYKPTPLVAPVDGIIIARKAEPGQTVTAQDVVLVLSDRLIVTAQVDETDIGQLRVGQEAAVKLDSYPDVKIRGVVRQIAFEAITVNNVTIYEVEVDPERIPDCMKSGMTATVTFQIAAAEDVLILPTDAIVNGGQKSLVLVDDGNPKTPPERRSVLTGLSGGGRVEILAGLDGNEFVVRQTFSMPERKKAGSTPLIPTRRR